MFQSKQGEGEPELTKSSAATRVFVAPYLRRPYD